MTSFLAGRRFLRRQAGVECLNLRVRGGGLFSKTQDRLLERDVAARFSATLMASSRSCRPKEGDESPPPWAGADFHAETRTNPMHAQATDPEVKLYRDSADTGTRLAFLGDASL